MSSEFDQGFFELEGKDRPVIGEHGMGSKEEDLDVPVSHDA